MPEPQSAKNHHPFLRRVAIRDYKSIARCQVELGGLTILVGRNGSGKSNFLDALHFLADALRDSLDEAILKRGGIAAVSRRGAGDRNLRSFAIELEFALTGLRVAVYGFEIAALTRERFGLTVERLEIFDQFEEREQYYHRRGSALVEASAENMPPVPEDRLYLGNAAGLPQFREAHAALLSMGFYNLNPKAMREPQPPGKSRLLNADGSNVAGVLGRIQRHRQAMDRIRDYLSLIVPGVTDVRRVTHGPRETLAFSQRIGNAERALRFYAASMSDGTLRTLGALVAVSQFVDGNKPMSLVGIEEPETALHPAAAGSLMEALREVAEDTQIVVTSHSGDLLNEIDPERDRLLVTELRDGTSVIAGVDAASTEMIRKHLYSPGELLRIDQLEPDRREIERQAKQLSLFPEVSESEKQLSFSSLFPDARRPRE